MTTGPTRPAQTSSWTSWKSTTPWPPSFEVGRNVARYPQVLVREQALGCEIASHSNAHRDLSKLKKSALLADLDAADQAFIDAVGFAPTMVRPPTAR